MGAMYFSYFRKPNNKITLSMDLSKWMLIPILKALSKIPLSILFVLSDFLYFIGYKIIGYRKKVVKENLRTCFPDKSEMELREIEVKFYKHLFDVMVETIRGFAMPKDELLKRYFLKDNQQKLDLLATDKPIMMVMTHKGNWEWSIVAAPLVLGVKTYGVYKILSNSSMEDFMKAKRGRNGSIPTPMEKIYFSLRNEETRPYIAAFIADQNPASVKNAFWTTFLNRDTPFMNGYAMIAKKMGMKIVFADIEKVKRGYYGIHLVDICEDASLMSVEDIMSKTTKAMERDIIRQPELWLWSHRRWKHKKVTE
jgi:KDO2-lipid IV(A) lauroyltransferase